MNFYMTAMRLKGVKNPSEKNGKSPIFIFCYACWDTDLISL